MNFLFDIGHPAHIHLLRNFAHQMEKSGHRILFTARNKPMTIRLLKEFNLPFVSLGNVRNGLWNKLAGLYYFNKKLFLIAKKFKPDIFLSHGSIYAAHVSSLLRKPHIAFEDTGNKEQVMLYKPFTDVILVSDSFSRNYGKKMVTYKGYHELAYLHPNQFEPDPKALAKYDLDPEESLVIIRFVKRNATHDFRHPGITTAQKINLVEKFSAKAKVLITSEDVLPEVLLPYQIKINPIDIFHVMAFSRLVFGESATMASEAAVLGIPAIFIDSTSRDYTREQEVKYGLVFNYSESPEDIREAVDLGLRILSDPANDNQFKARREALLKDKTDVTAFLCDFIKPYLKSYP
jgi:predicted glycosyltransferase